MKTLVGRSFGAIKVISHGDEWTCLCACGRKFTARGEKLRSGGVKACVKCLLKKGINLKHGGSKTRLYNTWAKMRDRCGNSRAKKFALYGGRGIRVCRAWQDFPTFRSWAMANGYRETLSIDRINSDRGYSPSNCRWISMASNSDRARRKRSRKARARGH